MKKARSTPHPPKLEVPDRTVNRVFNTSTPESSAQEFGAVTPKTAEFRVVVCNRQTCEIACAALNIQYRC